MRPPTTTPQFPLILLIITISSIVPTISSTEQQQPLIPGDFATTNTVPALPLARTANQTNACKLDLSDELFGGVGDACVRGGLDRSRCCPVLAAWLFAAHARSALEVHTTENGPGDYLDGSEDGPMMPDDNQKCVDNLQSALEKRGIVLPRPNSTCDTVLCFCGIRLHEIGSLSCPAAFNVSVGDGGGGRIDHGVVVVARNATPTAAVRLLERNCRNATYAGCTRCLRSLRKVRGQNISVGDHSDEDDDRANKMFARDCQLMGLTWLLAKNKTAYIPTVSAVLRAILYSAHPARDSVSSRSRCSPDQENMPLAVDALQFQHDESSATVLVSSGFAFMICSISAPFLLLLLF